MLSNFFLNMVKRFAGHSFATWSSLVTKALPIFLLPPFIFARFTPEEAAIWFIFITLQGMQLLIASSTGQPMVRGFAYALGGAVQVLDMRKVTAQTNFEPNIDLLSRVWSASSFAHVLIGIATLALLAGMGVWSSGPLISGQPEQVTLWGALAAFVVGGALRAYGGQFVSYLTGVNRIALLRWWEAFFSLLAFATTLGTLLAGGGLLEIALAFQIPLVANIAWNAWLCRRDQTGRPGFRRAFRPDTDILAQMWPSVWRTGLGTFIGAVVLPASALSYTKTLNAEEASALLYFISILGQLGRFAQVPFTVILPNIARMQARNDIGSQADIVSRAMMISYALHGTSTLMFAAFFYLVYPDTISTYLSVWFLFGIAGLAERACSMHTQWYATTNHVIFHCLNSISAVLFITALIILLPIFSMAAFPLAHISYLLIFYLPIALYMSRKNFASEATAEIYIALPILILLVIAIFCTLSVI
jgi:hypothetical protein